jgi:hypothetical protein
MLLHVGAVSSSSHRHGVAEEPLNSSCSFSPLPSSAVLCFLLLCVFVCVSMSQHLLVCCSYRMHGPFSFSHSAFRDISLKSCDMEQTARGRCRSTLSETSHCVAVELIDGRLQVAPAVIHRSLSNSVIGVLDQPHPLTGFD